MAGLEPKEISRKKLGNRNPAMIRHDYKRAVYRVFLSEFAPGEIREYFERFPLFVDGAEVRGKALYEALWKPKFYVPQGWEADTDLILERFLLSKGRDPSVIMPKILWLNGGSVPVPGKLILSWLYPKLENLFNQLDTREMCIGIVTLVTEKMLPSSLHRRIRKRERHGWIENVFVFIDDPTHSNYVNWDYEFNAGPQLQQAPVILGLPQFERIGLLADTRPPEFVIWDKEDAPVSTDGSLCIRGRPVGYWSTFENFCSENELDVSKYNPPNTEIVVMSEDYRCPQRQRIVLHKGCAYGAPFFISWTEHRKLAAQKGGMLDNLISDIDREEIEQEADLLVSRHRALLESLEESAIFTYHAEEESLSLNGRHFVKGIPAKIMRSLLQAYLQDGKTEFEYRDFKRDSDISLGQKNANFEVRLYRLMEKLAEEKTCVRLEKTGRGAFSLRVGGIVKLAEANLPVPKT